MNGWPCACGCGETVQTWNPDTGERRKYAPTHAPHGAAMARIGVTVPSPVHRQMCEEFAGQIGWTEAVLKSGDGPGDYEYQQRDISPDASRVKAAVNQALKLAVFSPTFRTIVIEQVANNGD